MRNVWILSCIAARTTLTKQIPIAVQLNLNVFETLTIFFIQMAAVAMFKQPMLFVDETFDMRVNLRVFHRPSSKRPLRPSCTGRRFVFWRGARLVWPAGMWVCWSLMVRKESPATVRTGNERAPESSLWRNAAAPPWWRTFLFRVLTGRQLTVFMYLLTCMDGSDECHPTIEEIRTFVGLNRQTMIFDALSALDRLGFIVRYPRMLPSTGGRRNLYRRPPHEYTVLKLVDKKILDTQLRVRHHESSYTPEIMEELDAELRAMLGEQYAAFGVADETERRGSLMSVLAKKVREATLHAPLLKHHDDGHYSPIRLRSV